jgi:Ca2+-binding RTX toxin-like protein
MATYQLNAADLLTLLASTTVASTDALIQKTLLDNNLLTGPITNLVGVQTNGPIGSVPSSNDVAIAAGVKLEVLTIANSTVDPNATYTQPTDPGPDAPVTIFDFTSFGGVVIASGDQATTVIDTSANGGDTLLGGAGAEKLHSTTGANVLIAGVGLNTLIGGSGNDTLIGGGHSRLVATGGNTTLLGGTIAGGSDTLVGGQGNDMLSVNQGSNRLVDNFGTNQLFGGSGDDTLIGGGTSSLLAGSGDTRMVARGVDTLTGGTGTDTMVATASATQVTFVGGSGFDYMFDRTGVASTMIGGAGGERVVLGHTGDDSILSGSGAMSILSLNTAAELVSNSSTAVGGLHTLTFSDGQVVTINDANSNITIHFQGGGTTTV